MHAQPRTNRRRLVAELARAQAEHRKPGGNPYEIRNGAKLSEHGGDGGTSATYLLRRLAGDQSEIERRLAAQELAQSDDVLPLAHPGEIGRGRNRGDDITPIGRGSTGAAYLVARLKRDKPEFAENFPPVGSCARRRAGAPSQRSPEPLRIARIPLCAPATHQGMAHMPQTLGQAAKAVGKNRTTILRALKAGKLSATHDEATGSWMIEPAELHRLYPPADAHASPQPGGAHLRSMGASGAIRELHARLEDKDAVIGSLERTVDDLRRRLDASEEERRRLTLMLADQRAKPDPAADPPALARRRWWWRR